MPLIGMSRPSAGAQDPSNQSGNVGLTSLGPIKVRNICCSARLGWGGAVVGRENRAREREWRFGGLGWGIGHLQEVGRIELGQGLAGLDACARIHQSTRNLSGDAEGQLRFFARVHFAGERLVAELAAAGLHNQHWPHFRGRGLVAAGRKRKGQGERPEGAEGMGSRGHEYALNSEPVGTLSLSNQLVQ